MLLMLVAGLWKHNVVAIPITAIVWLVITKGWNAWKPIALSSFAAASALVACVLFFPDFAGNMLAVRQYGWTNVLTNIGHLQWIAPAIVIWALWIFSERASSSAQFSAVHVTVSLAACLLQWLGHGVSGNAEFDLIIATAIGIGCTFARIETGWFAKSVGADFARDIMIAVLLLRLLVADRQETALLILDPSFRSSLCESQANVRAAATDVGNISGDVACAAKVICRSAGKPFVVDEFKMEELVATGRATEADITEMLRSRGIARYSTPKPTGDYPDSSFLRWLGKKPIFAAGSII
jgi:hypothetical protein